ncbi:MAG: NAD(P)/FAD-dependent oxidoreductase [Rubripirellula sp.]
MSGTHFDLIVVGTGPSGGTVARKAAKEGHNVAIVESRQFGGTCALRGCNPKKVYANAGSLVDQVFRASGTLVGKSDVAIEWSKLEAFKSTFTEPVAQKSECSFQNDGIATFHGTAKFTSESEIAIADITLSADKFLIATGATPAPLKFTGNENITRSDEFFELKEIPDRVLFIGGGYVSMEFAHVVARCGTTVTVVDRNPRVLTGFDSDLVDLLMEYSRQQGIDFRTNCEVNEIQRQANGSLRVLLSGDQAIDADLVVHGAGRVPNIADLNLDAASIQHDKRGVTVTKFMRSPSNDRVFATGDCAASGMPRLTPVANEEARIVAKNLFADSPEATPDYGVVPKVAFTTPAVAAVGLSETDARKSINDLDVRFEDTSSWGSVRKTGDTVAGYKLLIDKQTDKIRGAHLIGPAAEETINLFALAMKHGLTATDIKSTLFAFPTFASDVRRMT